METNAAKLYVVLQDSPNPDEKANWSLPAKLSPLDPYDLSTSPPPPTSKS